MKTRTARFVDSINHRLETLEARAVLSADGAAAAAPAPATTSDHQVLVADEAFLSAGSDQASTTSSPDDSEMYDFGGAWGTQAQSAAATSAHTAVSLDDGAVDQMGGYTGWTRTPADPLPLVTPQWAAPAEYTPMPAEFGPQADAPATPSTTVSAPAPAVNAPATPTTSETKAADQTPVVFATGGGSTADTSFVWIESSDSWLLTTKAKAAEQVVIQSTFVV